ncbi:conserved hypothetical protein (plasmid) [Rhodococcus jostii RHA1]|uniref:YCII-related domain-containing protein n=1 Tax=Rhodococcus jostii (strain RHA1) TaxID=101510 RepID=Q0RV79_RHOJR|nr:YciI family protein [Rhodococcus jostii]ABH00807.1 conserved hypothetical protein [Rhodococcus jostii RHA1]
MTQEGGTEGTFLVEYLYVPEIERRREEIRQDHRAYLDDSFETGTLRFAGAVRDPVDRGVLLVEADSRGKAMQWATADPVVRAGLVRAIHVHEIGVAYPRHF